MKKEETEKTKNKTVQKKSEESKSEKKTKIDYNKLPPLFKKSFSPRKFHKKIVRYVYIPKDKELVTDIFKTEDNPKKPGKKIVRVSENTELTKQQLSKLKSIAKDIKSHKARVRIVPLVAVVVAVIVLDAAVYALKNPLAKNIIRNTCEGIFGAKTDIGLVDVKIFSTKITVRNIAIGNKNAEFKNIFEANKIEIDFNLIQALRGKVDIQNLEASGMAFNTDRTTSCFLPNKKQEEEKENIFIASLNKEKEIAINKIKYEITNVLGGTDVDSIVANIQSNLKSPAQAEVTIATTTAMVNKWKAKPQELESQVNAFYEDVKGLTTINLNYIRNVEDLKRELEKIQVALNSVNTLKGQVEDVVKEVQGDYNTIVKLTDDTIDAAQSDLEYAKNTLTSVAGLGKSAQDIFTSGLDSLGYDILGKYYPYAKMIYNYALNIKTDAMVMELNKTLDQIGQVAQTVSAVKSALSSGKVESKHQRMEGTTFWYVSNCPSFLIERMYASGPGFEAELREVTNDPNVRNIPLTFKGSLEIAGVVHRADMVVDARKKSLEPLFKIEYTGSGFNTNMDGSSIAQKCGVPSIEGKSELTLSGTADTHGFTAGGNIHIKPISLYSDGFENALVTKYYNDALGAVTDLEFGYLLSYSDSKGLGLDLTGNFGQQFVNAITAAAKSIGMDMKNAAIVQLEKMLNESNSKVLAVAKEFAGIEGDIRIQDLRVETIQKNLENKIKEIEDEIYKQATAAANKAIDEATAAANKAVDDARQQANTAVNQATEAATKALSDATGLPTDLVDSVTGKAGDGVVDALDNFLGNFGFSR